MSTGATPRWPGPADGSGLGERVAAGILVGVVALALIVWLTAAVAAVLFGSGPAPALGDVASAVARLPSHLADPREAFAPHARGALPGPAGFYGAALLVLTAGVAAGLTLLQLVRWVRGTGVLAVTSSPSREDSARWARRGDLRALTVRAPQPGRVTLGRAHGRLLAAEERQSAIVIAPTQSMKTTGLAVPAILEWDGPVLATSVKTDLLRDTIDRRRQLGDVLVFDPTEATGLDSASWSPLVDCATWHGAQRTAAAMCAAAQPGGFTLADADFWYSAAAKLLGPVLLAAATVEDGSMADVVRWVDTQEVDEVRDALQEYGDEDALTAARATWTRDERQRSSIYTTAETVLASYADPRVLAAAYNPEPLADRLLDGTSSAVYLCAPAHEQARLRPLLATLVEQVIAAVYERVTHTGEPLDPPLLLVLDEAANVAPLASLDTLAATAAGQGIQLVSVFQDVAQIRERWGTRAATIVNNHRAKLIGSGIADPDTLDFAARILGDQEIRQHSTTASQEGRASTTESTAYRSLAPPHALRQAEHGTAVLVYGNLPPARVRLRPWFADRDLRRLAGRARS
ncbi:MAG: type IV secretory system conjugative DNA transfer family protein [Solirubrobacterales bacterium]